MDNFINDIIEKSTKSEKFQILKSIISNGNYCFLGAGVTCKNVLGKLNTIDSKPKYIVDDTPEKQGKNIDGIEIISFEKYLEVAADYVIIATMMNPNFRFIDLKNKLESKGAPKVYSFVELYYAFESDFLPYVHFDSPSKLLGEKDKLETTFNLLEDEKSKEIFKLNLEFRSTLNFELIPAGDFQEYFPNDLIEIQDNSVFIDCGAYNGDTIKNFLEKNSNPSAVYAFEPDTDNFNEMLRYCATLSDDLKSKITLFNSGVGEFNGFLSFDSLNNMASAISETGNTVIQVTNLDKVITPLISGNESQIFLKMDVEGVEPETLKGAKSLIQKENINLGISAYHNPSDLWELAEIIHEINPSLKFQLRQHGNDSMDLVLYAFS